MTMSEAKCATTMVRFGWMMSFEVQAHLVEVLPPLSDPSRPPSSPAPTTPPDSARLGPPPSTCLSPSPRTRSAFFSVTRSPSSPPCQAGSRPSSPVSPTELNNPSPPPPPAILGSLTPLLPPLPSERYIRKVDIINRGFSGYNTTMVLPIAKDLFAASGGAEVAFWTLWLGANDAGQPDSPALRVLLSMIELTLIYHSISVRSPSAHAVLFDGPSRQMIPLERYVDNLRTITALVPSSVPLLVIVSLARVLSTFPSCPDPPFPRSPSIRPRR